MFNVSIKLQIQFYLNLYSNCTEKIKPKKIILRP